MAIDVWECGWKLQGSTLVIMVLLFTMMGAAEGLVRQHADDDGWGGGGWIEDHDMQMEHDVGMIARNLLEPRIFLEPMDISSKFNGS